MGATTPEKLVRAGAKGTLSLTAVQAVLMALGYVGQIILARLLLPAGFGQFTVVLTMLVTAEVLVIEAPRAYSWALARPMEGRR